MKIAPGRHVSKIYNIIQLYESRKIPNITTALNIVSALSFPASFDEKKTMASYGKLITKV